MSHKLDGRLAALAEAVEVAEGRLDEDVVESARAVVGRAGQRLGLGLEATVVALAGPTGAGKSTLFNALAGAELATSSPRRPTTSAATAAVWGDGGDPLLDWLEVPRRHRMPGGAQDGLVLLDLPDFDSVEARHRLEVERLLELVDLVVWVVDPQKYADGALHERYLRPMAAYAGTMVVVLNQSDLLSEDGLAACRKDLGGLLAADGLDGVPILPVSARSGDGLEELWGLLSERVAARLAAVERLEADVSNAAASLGGACGGRSPGKIGRGERDRLLDALSEAAGVPAVARATSRAHRRRGALATGWPFVRWARRLRPDPLRRLGLGDSAGEAEHTSLPAATPVQRAQVSAAGRALAAQAAGDLSSPWPGLVRSAATAEEEGMAERLDRAVAGADRQVSRPHWWVLAGFLQKILAIAVALGAAWLLLLVALGYLQLGDVIPLPKVEGIALPTLLVGGGALAGLALALLARAVNRSGARRRARAATASMRKRVEAVATELVVEPVEGELAAYDRLCAATEQAAGSGSLRRRLSGR